jgi:hypothetical protein
MIPNSPFLLDSRVVTPVASVTGRTDDWTPTVYGTLSKSLSEPRPLVISAGDPNCPVLFDLDGQLCVRVLRAPADCRIP